LVDDLHFKVLLVTKEINGCDMDLQAICHPLYAHTMSGFKRAVRIIALVPIL
jgi:hypothetical protein